MNEVSQLAKKFPAFFWNLGVHHLLTEHHHWF